MKMITNIALLALFALTLESVTFATCDRAQLYCSTSRYDESNLGKSVKALEDDIAQGNAVKIYEHTFDLKYRSGDYLWDDFCNLKESVDSVRTRSQQICADYSKSSGYPLYQHAAPISKYVYPVLYKAQSSENRENETFLKSYDAKP